MWVPAGCPWHIQDPSLNNWESCGNEKGNIIDSNVPLMELACSFTISMNTKTASWEVSTKSSYMCLLVNFVHLSPPQIWLYNPATVIRDNSAIINLLLHPFSSCAVFHGSIKYLYKKTPACGFFLFVFQILIFSPGSLHWFIIARSTRTA